MACCMQSESSLITTPTQTDSKRPTLEQPPPTSRTHPLNVAYNWRQTPVKIKSECAKVVVPLSWTTSTSCISPLWNERRRRMPYQRPLDVLKEGVAFDFFSTSL